LPKVVDERQTRDILRFLFSGYNFSETAHWVGISSPTVSKRLKDFISNAERSDLMSAARSSGVEEQVRALMSLSQELKKNDVKVSDCLLGSNVNERLRGFGVDPSNLSDFVSTVYMESTAQDLKPAELVALCQEMRRIKEETGKSYHEIVDDYGSLRESNQVLSEENVRLEGERRENSRILREQVKENETTLETLGWFAETRDKLSKVGVDVEDIDSLSVLMKNLRESEYDADGLILFYSSVNELQSERQGLEADVASLDQRLNSLTLENTRCEKSLEASRELVAAVEEMRALDLNADRLRVFMEKVDEISSRHGYSKSEALEEFFSNVSEQYEPLLGYRNEMNRFESRLSSIKDAIQVKENNLEQLESVCSAKAKTIKSLKFLNKSDVSNEDLMNWGEILRKEETDPVALRREMTKLGGLRQYFKEKGKEVQRLEVKVEQLENEVSELELAKDGLEAALTTLTKGTLSDVKDELEKLPGILGELRVVLLDPETGLRAETLKMIDETHGSIGDLLNEKETHWKELLVKGEGMLNEMNDQLKEIMTEYYNAGKMVGEYKALKPIHQLQAGDDPGYHEGLLAILAMTVYFSDWFKKHNLREGHMTAEQLIRLV